ncbi:cysteine proteinase [Lentithecium fluviatile CBS 122367]|uniref:ubiquitinyl hydrolase 1 n=1 Tax=Lentithecium fluviatile CBS 122367 TaxID=1168545 RepID=A0A6G1J6F8_9PLEO|nr:cysteine proteinase [Lentithecium fluviatile CBS 122367]
MAGKPGKTAPRLLQDLLSYDPRFEERAKRNLLTSAPPHHDPDAPPTAAVPLRNCRHNFLNKEEQSLLPRPGEEPDHATVYKVASYCSRCRYHFDVVVDHRDNGERNDPCRRNNREFPLHHFLFQGEDGRDEHALGGFQTKPRTFRFSCSASPCPTDLSIRITPPRLSEQDVRTLTDRAVLRRRWEAAKLRAGDRADTIMARPVDAPDFLNTYLQDSLNPQKGKARIPLLNRKFLKTFGKDCDSILEKVGFTSAVETDDDGSPAHVWYLPKPPPAGHPLDSTEPTQRNLIEDVRYELNTIILDYPEQERLGARHVPMNPQFARHPMERALGCDEYPRVKGRTATRSANHEEDHPYYAGLGAVGDFADELLSFAYRRQMAVDEANAPYYFECLQDLAVGRGSESLQGEVAVLASQGCFKRSEVTFAYRYFDIEPAHAHAINDDHIIGVFRSRLADISQATAQESRRQLQIIGLARGSDTIKQAASDSMETYEQALSYLGMDKGQDDEFIPTMALMKTSENPANKDTVNRAIQIIAEERNSQRLRDYLEHGSMAPAAMDIGEAYAILQVNDRTVYLEPDILASQVQSLIESNPDSIPRIQEALTIVRQDQESRFGKSSDYQMSSTVDYPVETWPVGCCNIGNTCYLNSVLQFLFTIKPLREMVLNCEGNLQKLTPEALETKRVGRMAVSLARAETGQQFVRELRKLFDRMIRARTHNIRPERTLAALALTRGEGVDSVVEPDTVQLGLGEIGGLPVSGPLPPPTKADSAMGDDDAAKAPEHDKKGDNDDAKSDTSTTAMDLTDSLNVPAGATPSVPEPPSRPPPIPPRPQASADQGFKKVEEVARQQDAAEILNNVFDLLSCAFEGESTLRDGEQLDLIKKLFFSDVTTVRVTNGKRASKSDLQDNVHVSTKDRDRTLCAALDDEFGSTELEGDMIKFELFEEAAPIQIINVRRLQYENGRPRKDESHLALDKVLYLDRYLKKTKTLSEEQLQALRDDQWRLQSELRRLDERRRTLKETDFEKLDLPSVLEETAAWVETAQTEMPNLFSDSIKTESNGLASQLGQRAEELRPEISELHGHMDKLEHEIDAVFENCKDHPYRLHAIFIHAGSHSGGHYWIYIYDFQNNIWRSYNDETVKEETEETIFRKVQRVHPPTSTGIVYVRADVVDEYTQAVCRNPETKDVEMKDAEAASGQVINMDTEFGNIEVLDGVPKE